jgi:hypothetical protein
MTEIQKESVTIALVIHDPGSVDALARAVADAPPLGPEDDVIIVACCPLAPSARVALAAVGRVVDPPLPCGALHARNVAWQASAADLVFYPGSPEVVPLWSILRDRHASWLSRFVPIACVGVEQPRAHEVDLRFAGLVVESVPPTGTMWRRRTLETVAGFDEGFDEYDGSSWYGDIECQRRVGRWGHMVVATGIADVVPQAPAVSVAAATRLAAKQLGWLAIPWLLSGASDMLQVEPLHAWRTVVESTRKVMTTRSAWRHLAASPPRDRASRRRPGDRAKVD